MTTSALRLVHIGGAHPYTISIGDGLLDDGIALTSRIRGRHVLIVSDEHVAPLYARRIEAALHNVRPDLRLSRFVMPAGEQAKTMAHFSQVIDALATLGATRDACVLALGGGVVGDLAGFAAACWMRGIDCLQLPTTLLAMVDSSVGGKTAVDLPQGKNLVGAFHPPRGVFADTAALDTLPDRELRAGLAEVIKYGLICDEPFLTWLEDNMDALRSLDQTALTAAIQRSCAAKAEVVGADERESGVRATLNLGHTFGHAIETHMGYGVWLHGEAVAAGTVMALEMSARLGWITDAERDRGIRIFQRAGLPVVPPVEMTPADFMQHMAVDKKVIDGRMRLVLLRRMGEATVTDDYPQEVLQATLGADYRALAQLKG